MPCPARFYPQGCRPPRAFTLIELLVVVTIIVVLLALLTPALDKAIYTAEMLTCAARQKATTNAVSVYAANFKRMYPYRPVVETSGPAPFGQLNYLSQTVTGTNIDDRVPLKGFVPINKCLLDPFSPKVDIERSKPDTVTWSQYELWFGFRYVESANHGKLPGMRKVGDRLEAWDDIDRRVKKYNLLVSDVTQVRHPTTDYGMSGHRDSLDVWKPEVYQDQPFVNATKHSATIGWYTGDENRGTLDLNYGYQDGSVVRVDKIAFLAEDNEGIDYIPNYKDPDTDNQRFIQVPSGP